MAETWTYNGETLNVMEYERPGADIYLQEKELVPDPTISSTIPQSVLVGVGRKRKRRICQCWDTKAKFDTFEYHMYGYFNYTLVTGDGDTGAYLIEKMTPATRMKGNDLVWFTISFLEV